MAERVTYDDYFGPESWPRYPRVFAMAQAIVAEYIDISEPSPRTEAALKAAFVKLVPFKDHYRDTWEPVRLEHEVSMIHGHYIYDDPKVWAENTQVMKEVRYRYTEMPDLSAAAAVSALIKFDAAQEGQISNG